MNNRLENLILLTHCLLVALYRGRANKTVDSPRVVLIAQTGKLGDMVCTTPMFSAVKKQYPACRIVVLGSAANKDLLAGNSDVDEYLTYSNNKNLLLDELKQRKIDFACLNGPNFDILALLYLAGIPMIIAPRVENGYSPYETRLYKILSKIAITKTHQMGHYAPLEYLGLLEPIGIYAANTKKRLNFSSAARDKILELLKRNSIDFKKDFIVGITPSAGNKVKEWSVERFAQVADYLISKHRAKIIILGGPEDSKLVESMIKAMQNKLVLNTQGLLNIDELKALIAQLHLFISVDTGPIYIAEVFGVPTIDIVGPMDEREQPPYGKLHRVVSARKPSEAAQLHIMNARVFDWVKAREQVERITPEKVILELEKLIPEVKK